MERLKTLTDNDAGHHFADTAVEIQEHTEILLLRTWFLEKLLIRFREDFKGSLCGRRQGVT
jgi:hypothetical protein